MRTAARLTLSAFVLAILAACGGPTPPEPRDAAAKEEARARGGDTEETVFDDMIQTQDRARAVEDLTLGHKGKMDEAIRQSEDEAPAEER